MQAGSHALTRCGLNAWHVVGECASQANMMRNPERGGLEVCNSDLML